MAYRWFAAGSNVEGSLAIATVEDAAVLTPCCMRAVTHDALVSSTEAGDLLTPCEIVAVGGCTTIVRLRSAGDADAILVEVGRRMSPSPLLALSPRVTTISCGWTHAAAVCSDGSVWQWGSVLDAPPSVPHQLPLDAVATAVACGMHHTIILCASGALFAWGSNRHGQLGDCPCALSTCTAGPGAMHRVNALLSHAHTVATSIACGGGTTYILCADGNIITCGLDKYAQCGHDENYACGVTHKHVRSPAWVTYLNTPLQVLEVRGAAAAAAAGALGATISLTADSIAAGWSHVAATCQVTLGAAAPPLHAMVAWGRSDMGATSVDDCVRVGTAARPHAAAHLVTLRHRAEAIAVRQVACGSEHTVCVAACGCVFACGWDEHGALGQSRAGDMMRCMVRMHGVRGSTCPESDAVRAHAIGAAVRVLAAGASTFVLVECASRY